MLEVHGKEVAMVVPLQKKDWRDKVRTKVKLLVPPIKPLLQWKTYGRLIFETICCRIIINIRLTVY